MPVITISRQMYSFGDDIAEALSRRFCWDLITRKDLVARFSGHILNSYEKSMLTESAKYYLKPCGDKGTYLDCLTQELIAYTELTPAVLVGFGSQVLFANRQDALHVRIIASKDARIARAKKQFNVSTSEAEQILDRSDKIHKKFVTTVFGADLTDQSLYNLTLNTASLSVDECVASIAAMFRAREQSNALAREAGKSEVKDHQTLRPDLKNKSEEEFAKILDMYQLDWKYEPKTFPIEWDAEGNVTMAFSPDFYLTKFDTYIELTTMDQKYVTQKNKKVKKLRELYPGVNIKIVYKKDFYSLLDRFKNSSEVS